MITGWVIVVLISLFMFIATRKWTLVPSGLQNFVEAAMEAFYNLVTGIAGEENGRRFFPVVGTIFFFIVISNWLSLTPVFNSFGWVGPWRRRSRSTGSYTGRSSTRSVPST
jgi:F-type H+-transporting ATPase subunit a